MRVIVFFIFLTSFLFAQKADLTSAILAFNKKDTLSSKKFIDVAYDKYKEKGMNDKKPKNLSKFWHYRGQIYLTMNNLDVSVESFLMDINMNAKGGLQKKSLIMLQTCINNYQIQAYDLNKQAVYFFEKDDEKKGKDLLLESANLFFKSYEIRKNPILGLIDTLSLYNACLLNFQVNTPEADIISISQAKKLIELDPKNEEYQMRLLSPMKRKGFNEEYLSVIKFARNQIPSSHQIILEEVDFYLSSNDTEGLKNSCNVAIQSDPSNSVLHFALGTALQSLGDLSGAKEAYQNSLEINNDYLEAHNNLASMYLEETDLIKKKINKLGASSRDLKKIKELKKKRNALYEKMIPHLEACIKLDPSNKSAFTALMQVYYKLGDRKNKERIEKMIQSM